MFNILIQVIYFIVILPLLIFQDATAKFSSFLKRKKIYSDWGNWHSLVVLLIIILIILWINGYRYR